MLSIVLPNAYCYHLTNKQNRRIILTMTVKLNPKTHLAIKNLAEESGESMETVISIAIEAERRRRFFDRLDSDYEKLSEQDLAEMKQEHAEWDATLSDGLLEA
jgi:predicted transcriptional regulator